MRTSKTKISKYIDNFNKLSEAKQEYIFERLKNNEFIELNNISILTQDDIDLFNNLRNYTLDIIENNPEKEEVIKKLNLSGMEEDASELFYKYFVKISKPLRDAQILKTMREEQFKKIVEITLQRVVIYTDASFYSKEFLTNEVGLNNSTELIKVLRFLAHYISQVAGMNMSPEMLKYKMEKEFDIPEKLTLILYNCVSTNLLQIQHSYLLAKVGYLNTEMKKIKSFLEKLDLNVGNEGDDEGILVEQNELVEE